MAGPLPQLRVSEAPQHRRHAALLQPLRHELNQACTRCGVGIHIVGHVQPFGPGSVYHADHAVAVPEVAAVDDRHVRVLDRDPRPPADLHGLLHRLDVLVGPQSGVRDVESALVRRDRLHQLNELVRRRIARRGDGQPGGDREGPLLYSLGGQAAHAPHLVFRGRPVVVQPDGLSDGPLPHLWRYVEAHSSRLVDLGPAVQVGPVPVGAPRRRGTLDRSEVGVVGDGERR